jgi:hypothetical protein
VVLQRDYSSTSLIEDAVLATLLLRLPPERCHRGVTKVLERCYKGVIVVFPWRHGDVTVVLEWCWSDRGCCAREKNGYGVRE